MARIIVLDTTIATSNPKHLTRFPGIDAELWELIVP